MRTHEQELNYQKLELVSFSARRDRVSMWQALRAIWKSLIALIQLHNQIYIDQKRDSNGQLYWLIRQPGRRSIYCTSEQEVRIWLERYSRGI